MRGSHSDPTGKRVSSVIRRHRLLLVARDAITLIRKAARLVDTRCHILAQEQLELHRAISIELVANLEHRRCIEIRRIDPTTKLLLLGVAQRHRCSYSSIGSIATIIARCCEFHWLEGTSLVVTAELSLKLCKSGTLLGMSRCHC